LKIENEKTIISYQLSIRKEFFDMLDKINEKDKKTYVEIHTAKLSIEQIIDKSTQLKIGS
jgi:regulator of replication initiation timing